MKEYLIIGLGIIGILLILYLMIKFSEKFRKKAYQLFLFAENNVIKGRKMDYVVNQFYALGFFRSIFKYDVTTSPYGVQLSFL